MTDIQIIETLNNIKNHCIGRDCANCIFETSDDDCQIAQVARRMMHAPSAWDMEEIERLVKL